MKKLLIVGLLLTSLTVVGCDKEEEIDKVSNKIANEMTENNSSYDDAANKVLDGMNITTDDVPQEIVEEVEDKTAEIVEQQTQETQEAQEVPAYEEPVQEVENPNVPIQGEDLTPQEKIFNAEAENGIRPENLSYVQDLTLEDGQVVKVYVDMYELGVNSMIYLYATSEDGKVGVVYNFGPVYEAAHYNYLSSETVVTIHWLNSNEDPVNASDKMELLKVVMTVKDKELDARQAFGRTLN